MDKTQKPFFVFDKKLKNLVGAVPQATALGVAVYPAIEIPFFAGDWSNNNYVAVGSIYCKGEGGGIKNFVELISIENHWQNKKFISLRRITFINLKL